MTDMREDATARLEPELASLIRRLEMNYRRRNHPMERAHYLLLLQLQDGEKSTGEIAETLGLDHSTVVRQVAALTDLGFARRTPHPRDRRSVLVGMTSEGETALIAMRDQRQARLSTMLADWPISEVEHFARLVEQFNRALVAAELHLQ